MYFTTSELVNATGIAIAGFDSGMEKTDLSFVKASKIAFPSTFEWLGTQSNFFVLNLDSKEFKWTIFMESNGQLVVNWLD